MKQKQLIKLSKKEIKEKNKIINKSDTNNK